MRPNETSDHRLSAKMTEQRLQQMKSECFKELNGNQVMKLWRLGGCENFVRKREDSMRSVIMIQ